MSTAEALIRFLSFVVVLHYEGWDGIAKVTGAQFGELAKLVREEECQK